LILASGNLLDHVQDHPWPGCQLFDGRVTWMSSGIVSILLVGAVLAVVLPLLARRRAGLPTGGQNALEVLTVFVRDMIARPALHERAYDYLPLLGTIFVFVLGMNLVGLLPLSGISALLIEPHFGPYKLGTTPTAIVTVCAALASLALLTIVACGLRRAAQRCRDERGWPMWAAVPASPALWVLGLSPRLPGVVGGLFVVPLVVLELLGAIAKCFALMIRLAANMVAGHMIIAVLLLFVAKAAIAYSVEGKMDIWYLVPMVALAGAAVDLLELLVAGLQAYIFTFLTAMFIGLYAETTH